MAASQRVDVTKVTNLPVEAARRLNSGGGAPPGRSVQVCGCAGMRHRHGMAWEREGGEEETRVQGGLRAAQTWRVGSMNERLGPLRAREGGSEARARTSRLDLDHTLPVDRP